MAPVSNGLALIWGGNVTEGVARLKAAIGLGEAIGGSLLMPALKAFVAEGMSQVHEPDNALLLIDEAIAEVERPGRDQRVHYAEILCLKGWMLSLKGDLERAERNYRASLDWARRQQAKMWELRTSTSLAQLGRAKASAKTLRVRQEISASFRLLRGRIV